MTEQPEQPVEETLDADTDDVSSRGGRVETGHPAVDEVLNSLDRLDDAPIEEHPAVFERAHETLRSALTEAREASRADRA